MGGTVGQLLGDRVGATRGVTPRLAVAHFVESRLNTTVAAVRRNSTLRRALVRTVGVGNVARAKVTTFESILLSVAAVVGALTHRVARTVTSVVFAVVAFFARINEAVAALVSAAHVAHAVGGTVHIGAVITLLARILCTVATLRQFDPALAIHSAGTGKATVYAVVTRFAAAQVNRAIATEWRRSTLRCALALAVTAGVVGTKVTFFSGSLLNRTIATAWSKNTHVCTGAVRTIVLAVVTLFGNGLDAISAAWTKGAVCVALGVAARVVGSAVVALLAAVDHAIATLASARSRTKTLRCTIGVSVVALFPVGGGFVATTWSSLTGRRAIAVSLAIVRALVAGFAAPAINHVVATTGGPLATGTTS